MLTIGESIAAAAGLLGHVDVAQDFENFCVLIDNYVPEADSSANMAAVDKETGEVCNFVAVIPELEALWNSYAVGPDGTLRLDNDE